MHYFFGGASFYSALLQIASDMGLKKFPPNTFSFLLPLLLLLLLFLLLLFLLLLLLLFLCSAKKQPNVFGLSMAISYALGIDV